MSKYVNIVFNIWIFICCLSFVFMFVVNIEVVIILVVVGKYI